MKQLNSSDLEEKVETDFSKWFRMFEYMEASLDVKVLPVLTYQVSLYQEHHTGLLKQEVFYKATDAVKFYNNLIAERYG